MSAAEGDVLVGSHYAAAVERMFFKIGVDVFDGVVVAETAVGVPNFGLEICV